MRPLYVRQHEEHPSDKPSTFWVTMDRGNGKPTFVSETFFDRHGAKRAARAFIALLDPELTVVFSYWTGRVGQTVMRTEVFE